MKAIFTFLVLIVSFSSALAQDSAYDCDDPKCQSEVARRANPQAMDAQFLSHSIPCETGACINHADPGLGTDTTPKINPDGTPIVPGRRASPGDIVQ